MADLGEQAFNDQAVQKVVKFMSDGCGCALGAKGSPCSKQFSNDTVLFNLNNCLKLSSGELDLVILASIQAFIPVPRQLVRNETKTHDAVSSFNQNLFARTCLCFSTA